MRARRRAGRQSCKTAARPCALWTVSSTYNPGLAHPRRAKSRPPLASGQFPRCNIGGKDFDAGTGPGSQARPTMRAPPGYLPLTETALAVRELFERAGVEPDRQISYWRVRRLALDGVLVT